MKTPDLGGNSQMENIDEIREIMEEPAGGYNHGRQASDNPNVEGRTNPLDVESWQAEEFMRDGGFSVIRDTPGGERRGGDWHRAGGTTHRGVLHPDEYVDTELLRTMVEDELGYTYEEIRSVYRQGRLNGVALAVRALIDRRFLEIADAGGNMTELGKALGFSVDKTGRCWIIRKALERAREDA